MALKPKPPLPPSNALAEKKPSGAPPSNGLAKPLPPTDRSGGRPQDRSARPPGNKTT